MQNVNNYYWVDNTEDTKKCNISVEEREKCEDVIVKCEPETNEWS